MSLCQSVNNVQTVVLGSGYGENAKLLLPGGVQVASGASPPAIPPGSDNEYMTVASLSASSNAHLANGSEYALKVFARGGIPQYCGDVQDPNDPTNFLGDACDDAPQSYTGANPDPDYIHAFCENTSSCVAINDTTGLPDCFAFNTTYDVDDFTGPGQPEVCREGNTWCPEGFEAATTASGDYYCQISGAQYPCYSETNPDLCNFEERDDLSTNEQNPKWQTSYDDCSLYQSTGGSQSCCLQVAAYDLHYYTEVCVYPRDAGKPGCS